MTINFEDMHDGTFLASVATPDVGSVALGFVARDAVFDEAEVRDYVERVAAERRAAA